jgi:hypothetical protein
LLRLEKVLENDHPESSRQLPACLEALEPFIRTELQGRRVTARTETDRYFELKYRILNGKIGPSQTGTTVQQLSRLMLMSMPWFRQFKIDLGRRRQKTVACRTQRPLSSAAP